MGHVVSIARILGALGLGFILSWGMPTQAQEQSASHVIQPGETLFRIALNYGLTTDQLAVANNIVDATRIYAGQTLVIPGAAGVISPVSSAPAPAVVSAPSYHTVQRGETLRGIALRYGTTEATLIQLNNIANPNRILAGQQLIVGNNSAPTAPVEVVAAPVTANAEAAPVESAALPAEIATSIHTVQSGEYLSSIARRYGVPANWIISANNLANPDRLLVGQQLIVPAAENADVEAFRAVLYPEPGAKVGIGREIVVDLSNSRSYAYQDGVLVYEAIASMGLPATPTVQGSFTVRSKVRSQTMSGPGYSLPNVEWVLYFYQGYALHGTYWHNNFGQPMSHGCVNLTNEAAQWFYDFAEIGTPVTVQY